MRILLLLSFALSATLARSQINAADQGSYMVDINRTAERIIELQ